MTVSEFARALKEGSPLLHWTAMAHLGYGLILLVLMAIDSRTILGINPWIKPMKFILSSVIFLWTVSFLIDELGHPRSSETIARIVAIAIIIENVLINLQSARGVTSHFNTSSIPNRVIFLIMGTFIVVNTVALAWLLVISFRSGAGLPLGYLWGIRLGIAVFVLGSAEAGFMLRAGAHTIGAVDGGPGVPFLNWSTRFGDLRIGHFLGLHALQILPLTGWLIDKLAIPNPVLAVSAAAAVYTVVVLLATLQALAGKPLMF